jgi:hypothetical protein
MAARVGSGMGRDSYTRAGSHRSLVGQTIASLGKDLNANDCTIVRMADPRQERPDLSGQR